ncbi:hypothetical protein [Mesorhizobium delmotii]|uniref:hypothetical protein n=1 Tax=Mesorhizobium delmotii TaxID=1631247 RepID=UPI001057E5A5|nr:hypothetical protein [Mesorhizobium delmotii]
METWLISPVEARLIPTLRNGETIVRIHETVASHVFTRPYTEEEIAELPPHMREAARRREILFEETRVRQIADGDSPITARRGDIVQLTLEFSVPPEATDGITSATLVVGSSVWDTMEVPIFCVVGRVSAVPAVVPDKIRAALAPGEVTSPFVTIPAAPSQGSVVAFVASEGTIPGTTPAGVPIRVIHLDHLAAYTEETNADGSVEQVETGRSNGWPPLPVVAGQMVQAHLNFAAPGSGLPNITEATLVIASPGWQLMEIPLRLIIGRIEVELVSGPVTISQGGNAEFVVFVYSRAGPGDEVHFSLEGDDGQFRIAPTTLRLNPGQRAVGRLTLFAAADVPVGSMAVTFVARVFEQMQVHRVPLQINVIPGGLSVGTAPWSITAKQGDTVTFEVFANSEGPARHLTFTPGVLPRGVRCDPVQLDVGPGHASRVQPMRFVIDRDAPIVEQAYTPILWSANGNSHSGILNLPLTIELNPEERVFRRDFTTPSGTALGGFAEIVIRNDGSYIFRGHIHDSGFDPYAFRVSVTVRSSTGSVSLAAFKSGNVAGTIGSGSRDFDWSDPPGTSDLIRATWPQLRDGTADFVFWYEDNGVLGTLEDLAVILGEFLVGAVVASPGIAAIIVIGSELGALTEIPFAHPSLLAGVAVMGGVYMLLGPGMLLPAAVVGAIAGAQLKTRRLRPSEIAEAAKVFGDTLPIDRILVTNLSRGDHAFCIPHIDGSILMGLGGVNDGQTDRFDDPMKHLEWRSTLIHELVHAWQIEHSTTLADMALSAAVNECRKLVGDDPYEVPTSFDGRAWSKFGFEQQAKIVEIWYFAAAALAAMNTPPSSTLDSVGAQNRWEFFYIQNNIRLGQM